MYKAVSSKEQAMGKVFYPHTYEAGAPKVSIEASKAADELESWVKILENFKTYEPRRGRNGCDIINNFTQGMHPGEVFQPGSDLKKAQEAYANLCTNLRQRWMGDSMKAKEIDAMATGAAGEELVNRWEYFAQKLRANGKDNVATALEDTLKKIAVSTMKLGKCVGK
ncbi:hypothetical protein KCU61_g6434, partial [Aureobasidium melanogenum]